MVYADIKLLSDRILYIWKVVVRVFLPSLINLFTLFSWSYKAVFRNTALLVNNQSCCKLWTAVKLFVVEFRAMNDELNHNNLAVNVGVVQARQQSGHLQPIWLHYHYRNITKRKKMLNPHKNLCVHPDNRSHCNTSLVTHPTCDYSWFSSHFTALWG